MARELMVHGHRVFLANRNREKAEQARNQLIKATGKNRIELLDLDLSSLGSVRACAQAFLSSHDSLDVLINNAGLTSSEQVITEDGFELQFQVNALAQMLLTLELLPALTVAIPSQVIFVTSMMHKFGKLNFDSFHGAMKYKSGTAYSQSKLAMMLLARELAAGLSERDIAVNTLHPGAVNTGILDEYSRTSQFFLRRLFVSPVKGARTSMYLAKHDAAALPTGKYFINCKEERTHKLVEDVVMRQKLWSICCEYLGRPVETA
jgi:NAD(P)-dependent dehydrogenase (short-subunit alcohol dehydrogenase family)